MNIEAFSRGQSRAQFAWRTFAGVALALTLSSVGWGHGDLDESIAAASKEIQVAPRNAELYLYRGSLHRMHRDWAAAAADYDRVAALDPTLSAVNLARGEMLSDAGRLEQATSALSTYIQAQPIDPRGWTARARVAATQGRWPAAAEDFAEAVHRTPRPEPDLVLDYARALRECGKNDAAGKVLDEAMNQLGPLVVLVQPAIDLAVSAGRWDEALARLDKVIAASPRKERWLVQKGELLERANRLADAREAFEAAYRQFQQLPIERRRVAAMVAFETKLREALARVGSNLFSAPAPSLSR